MRLANRGLADWTLEALVIVLTVFTIFGFGVLFAASSLSTASPSALRSGVQSWEAHTTLLTYLRSPLPVNLPELVSARSSDAGRILTEHPEVWNGKTLGESITYIGAGFDDPATAKYLLEPLILSALSGSSGYLFIDYPPHESSLDALYTDDAGAGIPETRVRSLGGMQYDVAIKLRGGIPTGATPYADLALPSPRGETVRIAYTPEVKP